MSKSSHPAERPASEQLLRGFDDFELKLGDIMRGERATLGKSLLDVQRDLRIRAPYIAAIENTDPSAFETPGFIAGYVRSYARYLGMDPDETYTRFCQEAGFTNVHGLDPGASSPAPRRGRERSAGARPVEDALANPDALFLPQRPPFWERVEPGALGSVGVLLALVAGLGYGGWSLLREVQQVRLAPVEQSPQVMATLDPLATSTAPAEAAQPHSPAALDRLYRPQALDVPVLVARDAPIATLRPETTGLLADMPAAPAAMAWAEPTADPAPDMPEMQTAQAGPAEQGVIPPMFNVPAPALREAGARAVQVRAPEAPQLVLFAVRPAWVRVSAADGSTLLEKILAPGESYEVPANDPPPKLRAGNSGAVYFSINGVTHGPAGLDGQVTKNVALSANDLASRFARAEPVQDPDLATALALAEAQRP